MSQLQLELEVLSPELLQALEWYAELFEAVKVTPEYMYQVIETRDSEEDIMYYMLESGIVVCDNSEGEAFTEHFHQIEPLRKWLAGEEWWGEY